MKKLLYLAAILLLAGCGDFFFKSDYTVILPAMPETWIALLGQPHWRLQWLDPEGNVQKKDILPGENPVINIPVTWTNPVTAWPWWPQSNHSIIPEYFKPAGGLFPFDASKGHLYLSWNAGPDTVFYWELAYANGSDKIKIPANFDWPRFRELFTTGILSEEICKDPWLVNWQSLAERTISSNFDRRRIIPEEAALFPVPVGAGPWHGSSPFAEPLIFKEGEIPVFPVRQGVNIWISEEGVLRISGNAWVLTETGNRK